MSLRKAEPLATALTMDSRGINLSQVHRNTLCWLHPPLPDPALELLLHLNMQSQEDSHSALSHGESFLGWAPPATVFAQLEWLEASSSVSLTHISIVSLVAPPKSRKKGLSGLPKGPQGQSVMCLG